MLNKTLIAAALLVAAPIAGATTVAELARETGLSERNVRMLVGARTPYGEYRSSYEIKLRQFKQALGEENYDRLMKGEAIVLQADRADAARPRVATQERTPPARTR